jgi:hypothetical protein
MGARFPGKKRPALLHCFPRHQFCQFGIAILGLRYVRGPVALLTVPPYLAPTAAGLLLPVEVVQPGHGK